MNKSSHTSYYDLHGIVGISVTGTGSELGKIIHQDLSRFQRAEGNPDLKIILGEAPDRLPTQGFSLGSNLFLGSEGHDLVVLAPGKSLNGSADIQYLIRGAPQQGEVVTVYVPNLHHEYATWRRVERALFRGKFTSHIKNQADDLLSSIVEPFLYYRLVPKGFSLIHGAAVANDSGLLLFGNSNVGKTLLTMRLVEAGFSFLGDDLVFLGRNGNLYSYPKRVNLERYNLATDPELVRRLGGNMSLLERFVLHVYMRRQAKDPFNIQFRPTISEIFENVKWCQSSNLKTVVHLLRGTSNSVELKECDTKLCSKRLATNLFWEFNVQPWRYNRYYYSFGYGSDRDFLEEEVSHHRHITRIISAGMSAVRAFELHIPSRINDFEINEMTQAIKSLL